MNSKFIMRLAATGVLLLLSTVSSCSSTESGVANSQNSSTSVSSSEVHTVSSSVPEPDSSSIDPCGLLSEEDLAEVGKFESEYQEGGGARYCVWREGFEYGGGGFTFSVGVRDAQGINDINDIGGGVEQIKVNQRPAAKTEDPKTGDCMLAVMIGESSRVDVTILGEDGGGDSCGIAEVIAGLVEPHLPEIP